MTKEWAFLWVTLFFSLISLVYSQSVLNTILESHLTADNGGCSKPEVECTSTKMLLSKDFIVFQGSLPYYYLNIFLCFASPVTNEDLLEFTFSSQGQVPIVRTLPASGYSIPSSDPQCIVYYFNPTFTGEIDGGYIVQRNSMIGFLVGPQEFPVDFDFVPYPPDQLTVQVRLLSNPKFEFSRITVTSGRQFTVNPQLQQNLDDRRLVPTFALYNSLSPPSHVSLRAVYPPTTVEFNAATFQFPIKPLISFQFAIHHLSAFPSSEAKKNFFSCLSLAVKRFEDDSILSITEDDYSNQLGLDPMSIQFQFTPTSTTCLSPSITFPYRFGVEQYITAQSITIDTTGLIISTAPVVSSIPAGTTRQEITTFTTSSQFDITGVKITSLPTNGRIITVPSQGDVLNKVIDRSRAKIYFEPTTTTFPSCTRTGSTSDCLDTIVPPTDYITTFQHEVQSGLRGSGIIEHRLVSSSHQYIGGPIDLSVPAKHPHTLTFQRNGYDQLNPSFLDNFVVVIQSLPAQGTLTCIPFCNDASCQKVTVSAVPFVSNGTNACDYTSNGLLVDDKILYDQFTWLYSHRNLKIGSSSLSTSNIRPKRVNIVPTAHLREPEFWSQVGMSTPLNYTVSDVDWDLPYSNSVYKVSVISSNQRLRIHPSQWLAESPDLISMSNVLVEFLATQDTLNQYMQGFTMLGSDTCVAEITVSIQDSDPTSWPGIVPVSNSVLIANILNGNQDDTTRKGANSVIKNSAVLLAVVIGVPVLLALIVVVVCFRRRKRRKDLEAKRLALIAKKQDQVNESGALDAFQVIDDVTPEDAGVDTTASIKTIRRKKRRTRGKKGRSAQVAYAIGEAASANEPDHLEPGDDGLDDEPMTTDADTDTEGNNNGNGIGIETPAQ